jgi:hypothetical protein
VGDGVVATERGTLGVIDEAQLAGCVQPGR